MINFREMENLYALDVYLKRDLVLVRGQGARLWDESGKEYIDCMAGQGVANIGHCNPAVVEAVTKQAQTLLNCTGSFYNDRRALLMEKIISLTPPHLKKVFLCNSGTESVEAALKFARIATGKTDFICAMRSFHGRTLGALSATYNPKYREDFEPLVPGFQFVPYNNFARFSAALTEKTAAVLLEIVQGEGGVNIGERDYFVQVQDLCRRKGILLIIDEVQTGFCRTGRMLAIEHFGLEPDILCLAKSMAGGFPIGATVCADLPNISPGIHGNTFGGNPLASAAAVAAIDFMIRENLARQAEDKGNYFAERFKKYSLSQVRDFRQLGLLIGIELKQKSYPVIMEMQKRGILLLPAGATVVRLLPPLTIGYEDLDVVLKEITDCLK
jgi:LysW-gamma-L-lysine/LysW-L-ornithine aminotransferase